VLKTKTKNEYQRNRVGDLLLLSWIRKKKLYLSISYSSYTQKHYHDVKQDVTAITSSKGETEEDMQRNMV
jgi:hypothetical protein